MLKPNPRRKTTAATKAFGRFAIVAARYNSRYVDGMLRAAQAEFRERGVNSVRVVRVPGAFEIPVAAAQILGCGSDRPDAIICLGVVLQGATRHADHIGEAITHALMRLAVEQGVPLIHEVLLVQNEEQAAERCLAPETNRGTEAARTAIDMVRLLGELRTEDEDVPF